jgi:predicted transcriptional regulator
MADENSVGKTDLLELATELTIAWLANPNTRASAEEVPAFLEKMHGAVTGLAAPKEAADANAEVAVDHVPAVSVRKSLASKDHIISLIDGKPYKTLKRHLAGHGLTPADYRARYNLRPDYPMVAENYGAMRRAMAKTIGLGRKRKETGAAAATARTAGDATAAPEAKRASKPSAGRPSAKAAPEAKRVKAPRGAKAALAGSAND